MYSHRNHLIYPFVSVISDFQNLKSNSLVKFLKHVQYIITYEFLIKLQENHKFIIAKIGTQQTQTSIQSSLKNIPRSFEKLDPDLEKDEKNIQRIYKIPKHHNQCLSAI